MKFKYLPPLGALLLATLLPTQKVVAKELYNAALSDLGATAKGSNSNFNRDWQARGVVRSTEVRRGRGAIFDPFKGATIEIRLVQPLEIKALEFMGLNYGHTAQVSGVAIYIDGQKVTEASLPDTPGEPHRVQVEGFGQYIRIVGTGSHPLRTKPDGTPGPRWGGFDRISVLSPTNLEELLAHVDEYNVEVNPEFIQPEPASLDADGVKVYGEPRMTQGHPRTIWDQQDIDHYKAMLKTSPQLQQQYQALKRAMDERMQEPTRIPQPVKDDAGEYIRLQEREHGRTHTQIALDIANLATVYVLSGEEKYATFAKKLLLGYADVFGNYVPGNRPGFRHDQGKVFDQRLSDAIWLIPIARGYDLIYNYPGISPEERTHIEDNLLKAAARFIAANRHVLLNATNWSAICTTAVLITGYATDDQELIDLAMYGPGGTKEDPKGGVMLHFSERSISPDGLWSEGAIGYHFMALQALITNAEILWHHGIDMYSHRDGVMKQLFDSPIRFSYPDFNTPAANDSHGTSIIGRESYLYEYAYRRYHDPSYLPILNQAGMQLDAKYQQFPVSVLYDRDRDADAPATEWTSTNFYDVGFGILRNTSERGTISVLQGYGPNRSHGHPDKLQLDIWAFGDRLAPDPGMIWYEDPLYRDWYYTTIAHNTITVDEQLQIRSDGQQLLFASTDFMGIQRAKATEAIPGMTLDRGVFLTDLYVADIFGVFGRLPRKIDLAYHLRGDFDSDLPLEEFSFSQPVEPGYSQLINLRSANVEGWREPVSFDYNERQSTHARNGHRPWMVTTQFNGKKARLFATANEPTQIIVGNGILGRERPNTIIQRRETHQTLYGNVLDLYGMADGSVLNVQLAGSLEAGYGVLKIDTIEGTDYAFLSYRPGTYQIGQIETDASQVLVRLDQDDNIRAFFLGGGTILHYGDYSLTLDKPGLVSVEKATDNAWLVNNHTGSANTLKLRFASLAGMEANLLDLDGKRTGQRPRIQPSSTRGMAELTLSAGQSIEFSPAGEKSIYDQRQEMLRQQQAEMEAARNAELNQALARAEKRQQEAASNPAPAGTLITMQATSFSRQEGGSIGIAPNKRAAIGESFSGWNSAGHLLEYEVNVPAAGYYHLAMVYCSQLHNSERELHVNGEIQEPYAPLIFPSTGGWSNGSDDWRLFVVENPATEKPLLIKLQEGKNTIRLTNVNGQGVNLDYLAVYSPDLSPTREELAATLQ